jgi:hypothetical protein
VKIADRVIPIAFIIYLSIAVVVFGHAFHAANPFPTEQKIFGATLCAAVWPLYVSVQFWSQQESRHATE